jgi:50S ribosomal protein L16 3-hydroxylase
LPNWRIDDIMISYAADRGSVGPHVDNYDVFLIQGKGRRRWDIGDRPLANPELMPELDLKILKHFIPSESYELLPGDMLYLPPGFAHHGVALDPCITYSVGFRAPTQKEMAQSFAQYLAQHLGEEIFHADPDLQPRSEPGLILPDELDRLRRLMLEAFEDRTHFLRWVGGFLTEPRSFHSPSEDTLDPSALPRLLRREALWEKGEGVRMAFYEEGTSVYLAVEGETLVLSLGLRDLAALLCRDQEWKTEVLRTWERELGFGDLLCHLWNQGYIREYEDEPG